MLPSARDEPEGVDGGVGGGEEEEEGEEEGPGFFDAESVQVDEEGGRIGEEAFWVGGWVGGVWDGGGRREVGLRG